MVLYCNQQLLHRHKRSATIMDFTSKSIKTLFSDVTTVFTRAKQYAEETIGTAERTELDQQYESLAERADTCKQWTERIVAKLEAVIQPNPNMRYGDILIERMGTEVKRDRLRNLEYLGNDMIDAGIAFNPSSVYGNALVKVGKAQQNLGQTERDFVANSYRTFIIPLRKFLEEDMKTITKERKVLETKRLDLDAAKSRLRKAKNMETQSNAERDLKRAQEEFERQIEITKLLLEGLSSTQANHVRCLNDFVTSQIEFYNQCYRHMLNLQRELSYANSSNRSASFAIGDSSTHLHFQTSHLPINTNSIEPTLPQKQKQSENESITAIISPTNSVISSHNLSAAHDSNLSIRQSINRNNDNDELPSGKRRARCLNDYTAQESSEMNLSANEIIIVSHSKDLDPEWMLAERFNQELGKTETGKVPVAYLEILN